jgi:hypothetical protein
MTNERRPSLPISLAALQQAPRRHPANPEEDMAKGQVKGNKEAKKPKAEKPKTHVSAYKQSQGKGGQAIGPPGKKG